MGLSKIIIDYYGYLAPVFDRTEDEIELEEDFDQVEVYFQLGNADLDDFFELESTLADAVEESEVGDFDGNEIAVDGSDGYYFMYGPDGHEVFKVIKPILEATDFMKGAKVTLSFFRVNQADIEDKVFVIGE